MVSASTMARAPWSRLVPCSCVLPASGMRMSTSWSAALPYCCTTFSVESGSRARRTASSGTACSNLTITTVPPVKSMPIGTPPRENATMTPAMTIAHDRAMACQRHLTKLKLAVSKICMA